ncbi:MAG: autotransporter domain-containing protein, partial [Opitutales bacterium]
PEAKKYEWEFASFDGGIQNFSRDAFSVDGSGMTGADGRFYVTEANDSLTLVYKTAAVWNTGDGNWSTVSQWEDSSEPENTDNIEYVGAGGTSTNDDYITTIDGLLFTSDVTGAYTLNGSALSITLEGIINESSEKHTIAMDLELPTDQVVNTANGSLDISGVISGAGGLVKDGAETLTLSGTNTYAGGTTVNNGTLVGDTDSLQGAITNNGTVRFDQAADGTYASVMSGSGALEKSGTGTVTLSGTNTHTGGTTLNEGIIEVASGSALGDGTVTLNDGELLIRSKGEMQGNLGFSGDLNWNGGTIAFYDTGLSPESNDLKIEVGGNFSNGGNGGQFDFSQVEALDAGTYTLVGYTGTTDFQIANFSSSAGEGTTLNGTFSLENGNVLFKVEGATSSGTDIQNNGGVNTPVVSDYTIDQEIKTINQDNTVNSIIFKDDGNLTVEAGGQLHITSGLITVNENSNSMVSGGDIIVLSNNLEKNGDGNLKLENITKVENNNTVVNQGLLAINGQLITNNLIVQTGATLGGDGTVQGDVQVFGTLAPGNSPSTINITGDLTLDTSSTTEVEIESLTNYDQTIATGNITLDGTLNATIWGSGSIAVGDKYDVFQTTGVGTSITGEFDTYNAPTNYRIRLLNTGTIASLRFAPETYTLMAQTQNQFNVAAALDSFIPATTGDTMTVSIALDELTESEYPAAFEQVMPYFHESVSEILLDQGFHQAEYMQQRLGLLRAMNEGSGPAFGKLGWNAWTQVHLDSMRSSAFDATPAYENEREGFRVGADYHGAGNLQIGVFAARDFNEVDYAPGSSMSSDSIQFGAYATLNDGAGTYLDAIVSAGTMDVDTRRAIAFSTVDRSASGETESLQFNAAVSLGRDFKFGNFTFGPHAGLELSQVKIDGFAESGADSLNLGLEDQTVKSLTSEIGGHLSYRMQLTESLTLVPELRVSLNNELTDSGRTIQASLEGGEGAAFDYVPAGRDRNGVSTSLGFSALRGDDWSASVHWNTNSIERDAKSDSISISLNRKF